MTRAIFCSILGCVILECASLRAATSAPAATSPASLPEPTRVTLKLDHVPVLDAMKQLFKRAHVPVPQLDDPFLVSQCAGVTVTANFDRQPFDLAMLEICRQGWLAPRQGIASTGTSDFYSRRPPPPQAIARPTTGTTTTNPATSVPTTAPSTDRLSTRPFFLGPRPMSWTTTRPSWVDAPAMVSGPFVFVVREAHRTSMIDLDHDNTAPSRDMNISMTVLHDPRVDLFAIGDTLSVDQAEDPAGRSLLNPHAPPPSPPRPIAVDSTNFRPITARLAWPDDASRKLAVLRGHLAVSIVTRSEPVELVRDSKAIQGQRQAGGVRFTVGKLTETGDGSTLEFGIYRAQDPEAGIDPWTAARAIANADRIIATDAQGRRYAVETHLYRIVNNDKAEGTILFRPSTTRSSATTAPRRPKMPDRVIWQVPQEVQDFSVSVEFRDLALP